MKVNFAIGGGSGWVTDVTDEDVRAVKVAPSATSVRIRCRSLRGDSSRSLGLGIDRVEDDDVNATGNESL